MKEILPKCPIQIRVAIPGSKSLTHRALIAAALARGESRIRSPLVCEDTRYTLSGLKELGVQVSFHDDDWIICGTAGKFTPFKGTKRVFLGNSGTSYRLLLSAFALARGRFFVTGSRAMHQRPIGALVRGLNELGVEAFCADNNGFPPVLLKAGGIHGGKTKISGNESSQYVSSLLLSAPYSRCGVELEVEGSLVSEPYVDLTIGVMKDFGVPVSRDGYRFFRVRPQQGYRARRFTVEGDVSNASYFWAAAAVTGGTAATDNVYPHVTKQGDIAFLRILEEMGCRVERKRNRVVVHGGPLRGIDVDMANMPDMVPTLAALSLFVRGSTRIRNVAHLRLKESNRLEAIASEWNRLGGRVEVLPDGLIVHGGKALYGTVVDPHDDHRLAMSLAVVGLRVPGLRIRNEGCVDKSFPGFWHLWDRI